MLESWKSATAAVRAGRAEANEVRLLAQAERGDRAAFAQLYRAYFPRLARFLDRMSRDGALIEEVINDTMLVVWQKADTFNHTSKVSTWIFAIAYRKALKALAAHDVPVEAEPDDEPGDARLEPERALSRQQLQAQVAQALDALPLAQRTVVNLAYYHDMGYEEIASIMDCPVNTVKTRMFNARQRLRALLGGELEVER
ncbi:MAG TPA: sigma-70 family RNA polymerase sigma factor [Telluria sp.]|nr:sigma-70 family RNA polymerase sigma factor [Telluria sp.]